MSSADLTSTEARERPLRRDAERNRRRILEAAAEVFAERGLGVTMDDIADDAGVGVKELLIEALFEERIAELVALGQAALGVDDPWQGLVGFLERGLALQAANRGLKEIVLGTAHGRDRVAGVRKRLQPIAQALVARAQAAGQLRPEIEATDLPVIQMMLGAIVDFTRDIDAETWRRMLAIVIDGLRAREPRTPLPAPALDLDQLGAAMRAWRPAPC
jgi:AcrR family transcriptional regulator